MKKLFCLLLAGLLLFMSAGMAEMVEEEEEVITEVRLMGSSGQTNGAYLDGSTLVVTWNPDREYSFPITTSDGPLAINFEARFSNLDIDLRLNAVTLGILSASGMVNMSGSLVLDNIFNNLLLQYNIGAWASGNSDKMVDVSRLIESFHLEYDLSYDLMVDSISHIGPFDSIQSGDFWKYTGGVSLTTPLSIPLPYGFGIAPFGSLEYSVQGLLHFARSEKNSHFVLDYAYNGGGNELYYDKVPGEIDSRLQGDVEIDTTFSWGISLGWCKAFSVASLQHDDIWSYKSRHTLQEDKAGYDYCRDVTWETYNQGQFIIQPGIDLSGVTWISVLAYKEHQMAEGGWGSWGFTNGTKISGYIKFNLAKNKTNAPLIFNDQVLIKSGETAHLERDSSGEWMKVSACTHNLSLAFDLNLPNTEIRRIDCSGELTAYGMENLNWSPYLEGMEFLGWYTPDGDNFFENLDSHINPPDWEGELVLTARWKDNMQTPDSYNEYKGAVIYGFYTINGETVVEVGGNNISNPGQYYDDIVSTLPDWFYYAASMPLTEENRAHYFSVPMMVTSCFDNGLTLKSLVLNDRVRYCEGYKGAPALETLFCSDSVRDIGEYNGCVSLYSVRLPAGLTFLRDLAFKNCYALKEIALPNTITDLGEWTFLGAGLTSVTIPTGVKELKDGVFAQCKDLKTVNFTGHLDKIGAQTFAECFSLESIDVDVSEVSPYAFKGTSSLRSVTLRGDSLKLSDGIFGYYRKFGPETVTIDAGTLTNGADLSRIETLKTVNIKADSIQGTVSLSNNPNLRSVTIECGDCEKVAIEECAALEEVIIRNSGTLNEISLKNCGNTARVKIEGPAARIDIQKCYNLTDVEIPGDSSQDCEFRINAVEKLQKLDVPDGVREVSGANISNCPSLTCLTVPADAMVLGDENWKSIYNGNNSPYLKVTRRYASGVSTVEGYTLHFDSVFGPLGGDYSPVPAGAEITLPVGVHKDDEFVCWYVNGGSPLYAGDSFTMPAQDTTLYARFNQKMSIINISDDGTLNNLWAMDSDSLVLILPGSVKRITNPVNGSYTTKEIYIPAETVQIEPSAFFSCHFLERIHVDPANPNYYDVDGVLYSRDGALVAVPKMTPLKTLVLPDGLKTIRSHAFLLDIGEQLKTLQAVYIPESVTTLEEGWEISLESCDVYGPMTGPVAEEAQRLGLQYNVFPVVFVSKGELEGIVMAPVGETLPALKTSTEDGTFLGWSTEKKGSPITGNVTVPYGGLVLYALWTTEEYDIDFVLPGALTEVGAEAFAGIAATGVRVGEGVKKLGSRAFADCARLTVLILPSSLTDIADDALAGCGTLTVVAPSGSYAAQWAKGKGFTVEIED